jgi:hypothetical protein
MAQKVITVADYYNHGLQCHTAGMIIVDTRNALRREWKKVRECIDGKMNCEDASDEMRLLNYAKYTLPVARVLELMGKPAILSTLLTMWGKAELDLIYLQAQLSISETAEQMKEEWEDVRDKVRLNCVKNGLSDAEANTEADDVMNEMVEGVYDSLTDKGRIEAANALLDLCYDRNNFRQPVSAAYDLMPAVVEHDESDPDRHSRPIWRTYTDVVDELKRSVVNATEPWMISVRWARLCLVLMAKFPNHDKYTAMRNEMSESLLLKLPDEMGETLLTSPVPYPDVGERLATSQSVADLQFRWGVLNKEMVAYNRAINRMTGWESVAKVRKELGAGAMKLYYLFMVFGNDNGEALGAELLKLCSNPDECREYLEDRAKNAGMANIGGKIAGAESKRRERREAAEPYPSPAKRSTKYTIDPEELKRRLLASTPWLIPTDWQRLCLALMIKFPEHDAYIAERDNMSASISAILRGEKAAKFRLVSSSWVPYPNITLNLQNSNSVEDLQFRWEAIRRQAIAYNMAIHSMTAEESVATVAQDMNKAAKYSYYTFMDFRNDSADLANALLELCDNPDECRAYLAEKTAGTHLPVHQPRTGAAKPQPLK